MYSELECGICYQTYNAGRRCPRELQCKHTFCESCLLALALARPLGHDEARLGAHRSIVCPLCRHPTSISGEGRVRAALRLDECVLERILAAGVLDQEEEEEDPEDGDADGDAQSGCDDSERASLPETTAEESDALPGSRGGRLRRSWRKVWRKISGKSSPQRDRGNCMTGDDMRNLAMMACYMF